MKKNIAIFFSLLTLLQNQVYSQNSFAIENKVNNEKKNTKKPSKEDYYNQGREAYLEFSLASLQDSIKLYNKAINIDKNFAKAIAAKSESQARLSKIIYEASENITETSKLENSAFENAFIAIELNPNIKETHRAMSTVYFMQKKYNEGKISAKKALQIDEDDSESNLILWLNSPDNRILKKSEEEEDYYKSLDLQSNYLDKTLELNPNLILAYFERAKALLAQNEYFKSVKNYKKILEINPKTELAYVELGNLYLDSLNNDEAIAEFMNALDIDPDRYDVIYNLGILYLKKKDTITAREYFSKVCEYNYMDSCDLSIGKYTNSFRKTKRQRRRFNFLNNKN